ncbi:MAG: hydantoinase/oxoprolinase family protein [Pikeienuella sp.]|uniref:hydantoinase/oxoprolinase family protein n=1 Tax=Pikeienuella sp. TaxID=2831957 RepID=UPI003919E384
MRFAVDTGGTFTDLLVEHDDGRLTMHKAATTPQDPIAGVIDSLARAAEAEGVTLADLLAQGDLFIHGTTRAINAIVTGATARTAFLTTRGHPDILVLREGGRKDVFDFTVPFPEPYVSRSLTWEADERIMADGSVRRALDEAALVSALGEMKAAKVEAVAVCLLWSIVNPAHELRIGELIEAHLPGVPYTLSHAVNPSLREYRRASSTAIDASLKPLMSAYMGDLTARLRGAGYAGRVLIVTSNAGVIDASEAARAPIHLINSGPAMAPVAGRHFAEADAAAETAIVADTGGTTYDLSVVRRGSIPLTRETWIGGAYRGHMTGFPSVDVRSIGAGGGSIAWVDAGGLLRVGPQSAAAEPGPAAYGRGGEEPTVTDACVALGWLDPDFFLGGAMKLRADLSRGAIEARLCGPLGLSVEDAALAVIRVATENMVQAILDITVNQGIDPREAVLIGGGGAAGLNSERIAARLGCPTLLIPDVGAALSAAGALMSELVFECRAALFAQSGAFDAEAVNAILAGLRARCEAFIAEAGDDAVESRIAFGAEARYPHQVWEIDLPLRGGVFGGEADIRAMVADFHAAHDEIFAISDPESEIEVVSWTARASCRLREGKLPSLGVEKETAAAPVSRRRAYFERVGWVEAEARRFEALPAGAEFAGPALVESSFTTVVVGPGATYRRTASGGLSIKPAKGG